MKLDREFLDRNARSFAFYVSLLGVVSGLVLFGLRLHDWLVSWVWLLVGAGAAVAGGYGLVITITMPDEEKEREEDDCG